MLGCLAEFGYDVTTASNGREAFELIRTGLYRLVVSDWEADNPRIADLQSLAGTPNVEAKLSTVPEWSGGYIPFARVEHCKYMVVDSLWTWVGTSNWEPGYFHGTRNVAVSIKDRTIALEARKGDVAELALLRRWRPPFSPSRVVSEAAGVRQYWKKWDNRCLLVLLPAALLGIEQGYPPRRPRGKEIA